MCASFECPASSQVLSQHSAKPQRTGRRPGLYGSMAEASLLVVEDDPNILELLSASLRFAGFEVRSATSGSAAVSAAQDQRPDLVVLDVMLPDVDGFEVIKRLRAGGDRVPVVFLTAR